LQAAVNERRNMRVNHIQQTYRQIEREKVAANERQKQLELEKFQGL
jgi:hypothetical protein